jgi:hypothetical protein
MKWATLAFSDHILQLSYGHYFKVDVKNEVFTGSVFKRLYASYSENGIGGWARVVCKIV